MNSTPSTPVGPVDPALPTPSVPLPLSAVRVRDAFWSAKQRLVREEVIPYQWEALHDRVPGAEPSWCIHNFTAAARQRDRARREGDAFVAPELTGRGFQQLPADPENPDPDAFYGLVFQDSDLAKFIEAASYSLETHPDPRLEADLDEAIALIGAAQLENGYIDTYYILTGMDLAFTNLQYNHELYCFGHLAEAAVAHHRATGKHSLLDIVRRFADHIDERFGREEGKLRGYPGHEEAELALVRLHEVTGEERYLELARFFIEERGQDPKYFEVERQRAQDAGLERAGWEGTVNHAYFQSHAPVREQEEAVGHAVRAGYLYAGMADVARATGDASLVEACERLWRSIVDRKLYITGGIGGTVDGEAFSYDHDLPNDTAYSETCAAISLVLLARRMLQLRPRAEYADVMELALFNTVLAGMDLDGRAFFYVNPLEATPAGSHRDSRKAHVKIVRQPWFGCACCPPNLARLLASLQSYAYTATDDALLVHLYLGGDVEASLGGTPVRLEVEAGMPWSGTGSIRVRIDGAADGAAGVAGPAIGTLALRVPGWSGDDGAAITSTAEDRGAVTRETADGYVRLTGDWADGDLISFDFPMPVRIMQADPRVREDAGRVAIQRGPITFCAESADNGEDLHLLSLDPSALDPYAIAIEEWDALGEPMVRLRVPARRDPGAEAADAAGASLYTVYRGPRSEPAEALLIPYFAWANRGENEMSVWLRA
ncbi:glycoside hydrolase family 127 protein [Brachybacterium sp. DNPG3]